ncbi:hypothetical protein PTKU64_55850 [Paraburkholderia terrae]|uniref:Uncharacterized protein n=1 Tax=Paraburkholderia terrae TaxID=311230 RepID=A0ABM7U486_9BURK|nr:hypothetical protein [Paraburkholderia terrae]BCZ81910.1 hypothetical protein PTKU64_55850 [Paraburkholderia terrae]
MQQTLGARREHYRYCNSRDWIFVHLSLVVYQMRRPGRRKSPLASATLDIRANVESHTGAESPPTPQVGPDGVRFVDGQGAVVFEGSEIPAIPLNAVRQDASSHEIGRVAHLAADMLKGSISLPNKTVHLLFKPEIAQGLKDGTYELMQTKAGEVLADAVDASNQIVGKGRIVQAGQVRQLAAGAFQLVSIAVAQSHLADIERSLGSIKGMLSEVLERLENTDRSNISGAIRYLSEVAQTMKGRNPALEFSSEKSHVVEATVLDWYKWRDKVRDDMVGLAKEIMLLEDSDRFGTSNTHEELKRLVERAEPLLRRYELLLQLAAALTMITAYLDPTGQRYTRVRADNDEWLRTVASFRAVSEEKAKTFLSKALFTSNEMLRYRKTEILRLAHEVETRASGSVADFGHATEKVNQSLRGLVKEDGAVGVALYFDKNGAVKEAAFV